MRTGEPSDDDLVRMFKAGDGSAFSELYRRHRQKIMNFAFRMIGDRDLAADALQETFGYLFRKIPEYRPEAKLSTLLFKAARSICLNMISSRRRLPSKVEDAESIAGGGDPSSQAEESDLAEKAAAALGRLPEIYREVIILRVLDGMACSEIAEVLGIPEGTVKSRAHNGLEMLRGKMGFK